MNGSILRGMPIAVDCFLQKHVNQVKLFFLTHMHSDHTVGLSAQWQSTIYCSLITGRLLQHKFKIPAHFIEVLEPDQPHLLGDDNFSVTVHLLPADHCPGSCMFKFETEELTILYTGDFRFDRGIPHHITDMKSSIDLLYLDNTYCEPACDFPSRAEALQLLKELCQKHLCYRIFIGMSWTGHEDLLVFVASELQEFVFVEPAALQVLKILELSDVFRTGRSVSVNAIPNSQLTCDFIKLMNQEMPTIGIKPTGMFGGSVKNIGSSSCPLYAVPYSNHSNFAELCKFVGVVKPVEIRPIVPGRKGKTGMESSFRANMHQFDSYLSKAIKVQSLMKEQNIANTHVSAVNFKNRFCNGKPKLKKKVIWKSKLTYHPRKRGVRFEDQIEPGTDEKHDSCSSLVDVNQRDESCPKLPEATSPLLKASNLDKPATFDNKLIVPCGRKDVNDAQILKEIEDDILANVACFFFKH